MEFLKFILKHKCAHIWTFLFQNDVLWDICLMHWGVCEMGWVDMCNLNQHWLQPGWVCFVKSLLFFFIPFSSSDSDSESEPEMKYTEPKQRRKKKRRKTKNQSKADGTTKKDKSSQERPKSDTVSEGIVTVMTHMRHTTSNYREFESLFHTMFRPTIFLSKFVGFRYKFQWSYV